MPETAQAIQAHLYWPHDAQRLKAELARWGVPFTERRRWMFWRQFDLGPIPEHALLHLQRFHQDVVESEQAW